MTRLTLVVAVLAVSSCKKDPPTAPAPPTPPVAPQRVTFGPPWLIPGTRIVERWSNELVLPVAEGEAVSTIERGSVNIDVAIVDGGSTAIALHFGGVERLTGPTGQEQPEVEKASNATFSFDLQTGEALVSGMPAAPEVSTLVRERLVPWLQPMAFTRALQREPVTVGAPNSALAMAFASDFAAKERIRGTPALEVSQTEVTLSHVEGGLATFTVKLTFTLRDAELLMRVELQGEQVVDVASSRVVAFEVKGPVVMEQPATPTQGPVKRFGSWRDVLTRTVERPDAG
ncbi:MAG: hypothetical protein JNG84_07925 [Archangium sp.]|nr:hypothetical protein [Archangium sp.]